MDITLEDVETAIRVLNQFMRKSREAQMTIKRFEVTTIGSQRMPQSMQDFMDLAYRSVKAKRGEVQEEPEPEPVTEKDLARMKEIREKMKGSR